MIRRRGVFRWAPYFPIAGQLPTWGTTRVHLGLIIALVMAVLLALMLRRTRFGYEMQMIGASPRAARYAGMNIPRTILLVSLLSGGLAGLAGMTEVSGVIHRLQEGISPGYGFTAIIVVRPGAPQPARDRAGCLSLRGVTVGRIMPSRRWECRPTSCRSCRAPCCSSSWAAIFCCNTVCGWWGVAQDWRTSLSGLLKGIAAQR